MSIRTTLGFFICYAQILGQKAHAPVRGIERRVLHRGCNHPLNVLIEDAALYAPAERIGQASQALLGKALLLFTHANPCCDSQVSPVLPDSAQASTMRARSARL